MTDTPPDNESQNKNIKTNNYVEGNVSGGTIAGRDIHITHIHNSPPEPLAKVNPTTTLKNTIQDKPMSDNHPIKLFYSYSHKDEVLRNELETHLKLLKRQKVIDTWHDRKIGIGTEWKDAIDENLEAADIILLLISADFLASDYCWDIEVKQAIKRHKEKSAVVIPIALRPCDTSGTDFMTLQGLPKDFKPVITWEHQDEAFTDIAKGIRACAEKIRNPK